MGNSIQPVTPISPPIPFNKTRICVASFTMSRYGGRGHKLAAYIAKKYSNDYETWYNFTGISDYYEYLKVKFDPIPFPEHLKGHDSSPFCWLERGENKEIELIGGCSEFQAWAKLKFSTDKEILDLCEPSFLGLGYLPELNHADTDPATCYNIEEKVLTV